MNPNPEHELETLVDRELKSLPLLDAPPALAPRILAALARAEAPWYRQAWTTWPLALRTASFVLLSSLFGGLCAGAWSVYHSKGAAALTDKVGGLLSVFELVGRTLGVLRDAVVTVAQHVGPGYLIGFAVFVAVSYAVFAWRSAQPGCVSFMCGADCNCEYESRCRAVGKTEVNSPCGEKTGGIGRKVMKSEINRWIRGLTAVALPGFHLSRR
jgi:hypothetical protein